MNSKLRLYHWNDLRLRNKLLILYFAAVFVPIVLTNSFFYTMTAENVRMDKSKDLKQSLERNKDNFRKMLEGIISFSAVIYNDGLLYSALDETYTSQERVLDAYNNVLNRSINRFVPLNKQFYNAYLYTDNETLIHSGMLQDIDSLTQQQEWYLTTTSPERSRKWMVYTNKSLQSGLASGDSGSNSEAGSAPYLSVIRELDFYKAYSNYRKILKIDILPKYLENALFDHSFPGQIYLINPESDVIYSSEEETALPIHAAAPRENTMITSKFEDVEYLKGWQMAGVYPNSVIDQSLLNSRKFIIYLTCANLLFPSFIILIIARSLNSRLGLLLGGIKRVKNQRFDVLRSKPATDEIGQLTEEFNSMTLQINDLIQDVYIAELDRRQAQFNALQSQINPHYLYNTLDAIRMNCLVKGEHETASMIKLLGRGFRRSLSWEEDMVPLEEEMEFVTDYLDIQHFRFGQHLSYQLDIDERVLDVRIPKMSILALTENACIHGIEHLEHPGIIVVTAGLIQQRVIICVSDNGVGMEPAKLSRLLASLENRIPQGRHVGLKNMHDRLKWHFGSAFKIKFVSAPAEGTQVKIEIPARYETNGEAAERRATNAEDINRGR